ncbi:hypothetical protein BC628DRAFT_675233 [Trametes gibbosa]|nr:hypothetical protein BC628DRAFT_675233 [Trametes gibbosa]
MFQIRSQRDHACVWEICVTTPRSQHPDGSHQSWCPFSQFCPCVLGSICPAFSAWKTAGHSENQPRIQLQYPTYARYKSMQKPCDPVETTALGGAVLITFFSFSSAYTSLHWKRQRSRSRRYGVVSRAGLTLPSVSSPVTAWPGHPLTTMQ